MKAHKTSSVYTAKNTRRIQTHLIVAPVRGGDWEVRRGNATLLSADLGTVTFFLEDVKARHPGVTIDADSLLPRAITGRYFRDYQVGGQTAHRAVQNTLQFRNADQLYHYLRRNGYYFRAPDFVSESDNKVHRIYRSHDTFDSMTAWEIALFRMENQGDLPEFLEVPADTCPCCLSRFVSVCNKSRVKHCMECNHVSKD